MDSFILITGTSPFVTYGAVRFGLVLSFFFIASRNTNNGDPDQAPRFTASDLGLHCLHVSLYGTIVTNGLTVMLSNGYI